MRLPARAPATEVRPLQSTIRFVHSFADRIELEVDHRFADRIVTMHWSLLTLREDPMRARFADRRVPYLGMGTPENVLKESAGVAGALPEQIIYRYRLDKKDTTAAVSDVVKPILFYLDPNTPKWLVPWIKRGVEAWRPAFESIGFRNAIVAREHRIPKRIPTGRWRTPRIVRSCGSGRGRKTLQVPARRSTSAPVRFSRHKSPLNQPRLLARCPATPPSAVWARVICFAKSMRWTD